jgi:hypothetical protein
MRPSSRHIWIAGYWHWAGNHYAWVRGHWVLPPHEGAVWVAPHVEHRPGGNIFIAGFWRHGAVNVVVRSPPPPPPEHHVVGIREAPPPPPPPEHHIVGIREAPPPLRHEEMVVARPSSLHVWIAGYWRHDGRAYVWVPGHWDRPPRQGVVWIGPRWELREGAWVFTEGRWDHEEHPHR